MSILSGPIVHDAETELSFDGDRAVFKRTQELGDSFFDNLDDQRLEDASQFHRMGDMYRVASIPTVVVEQWMAEGFNIYDPNVGAEEILSRLRAEDMSRLISTSKSI